MRAELQYALRWAQGHHNHVVLVVPPEQHRKALDLLVAHAGAHTFGGRSLRLPGGGCLSVMSAPEPIPKVIFDVMFSGWGPDTNLGTGEMNQWCKAANQVLTHLV